MTRPRAIRRRATSRPMRSKRKSPPGAARRMAGSICPSHMCRGARSKARSDRSSNVWHRTASTSAPHRSRSRPSRITIWAGSRSTSGWRAEYRACSRPARRRAVPTAPTGSPAMRSPRHWCSANRREPPPPVLRRDGDYRIGRTEPGPRRSRKSARSPMAAAATSRQSSCSTNCAR